MGVKWFCTMTIPKREFHPILTPKKSLVSMCPLRGWIAYLCAGLGGTYSLLAFYQLFLCFYVKRGTGRGTRINHNTIRAYHKTGIFPLFFSLSSSSCFRTSFSYSSYACGMQNQLCEDVFSTHLVTFTVIHKALPPLPTHSVSLRSQDDNSTSCGSSP